MTEERCPQLVDYFVVAGLGGDSSPLDEEGQQRGVRALQPVTDLAVIARGLGEDVPEGFTCIEKTQAGHPAELSAGLLNNTHMFLCYRRGHDKPPLVELGVLYEGKDPVRSGWQVIETTPYSRSASLSSGGPTMHRTFLMFRRAPDSQALNTLGITEISLLMPSKGETAPHTYCRVDKNLNTGMWGPALYLCYKRSVAKANALVYEAGLISRYPEEDLESFPLPDSVPVFCLPMGVTVESWPLNTKYQLPIFSTFVLTSASGDKVRLLTAYDPFTPITTRSASSSLHASVRRLLTFIYRYSISGPHVLPLEKHISSFMHNVPFPSAQRPRILVQLSSYDNMLLCQPVSSPLPLSGASFVKLLQNLGPENACSLLLAVLTEHKLLLHSLRPDVLTSVSEALVSVSSAHITSISAALHTTQTDSEQLDKKRISDALKAAVSSFRLIQSCIMIHLYDPPTDVVCVDLDTNTIFQSEDKKPLSWRSLPRKHGKILLNSLSNLHKTLEKIYTPGQEEATLEFLLTDYDLIYGRQKQLELEIQEAFLRFMSCLLRGYRSFLLPITQAPSDRTTDCSSLFHLQGFLKSRDRAQQKFYTQLSVSVDVEKPEDVRLIDRDECHSGEHTVFIMPPEEPQEADGSECPAHYRYDPQLKGFLLFCRSVEVRETLNRKSVDENYNNVSSPSRGLAGKLQQLLTPTRNRASVRRAASVDDRRPGANGHSRQKPSRKSQMTESLLKAKERLYNATSESSLSVGSDIDMTDIQTLAVPLRKSWDSAQEGVGIEVLISSCSLCPFCSSPFVPLLNAEICDPGPVCSVERSNLSAEDEMQNIMRPPVAPDDTLQHLCNGVRETDSSSETSSQSESSVPSVGGAPQVTVAYLSPLVLRKEMESLLENEGEAVLSQVQLLDSHSILFWNLVWYFTRLGLPSNLLQLLRTSPLTTRLTQGSEGTAVHVRLLWDTLTPDTEQWPALYMLWRIHSGVPMRSYSWRHHNHPFNLSFLEEVLRWIGLNEVHKAIMLFLDTVAKQPGTPRIQRSLYREMLFLTVAAMGKDHVASFDKRYKAAYVRLSSSLGREELRRKRVQPPSPKAVDCRRCFLLPLEC
ncbi:DENN domain-containing protein 4B-like [Sinocyclocheilus anshuiensis]|uniref:DENN domain-containing protein 4B-like n=1 Tax=Sinocyclocheilus anshuiensis TaxID=1608454 RepID=UPI0007B897C4|nr:PREDICTED: DENN domain-containing protein 4B-like [Sinocyclocheilus anshuiensis]